VAQRRQHAYFTVLAAVVSKVRVVGRLGRPSVTLYCVCGICNGLFCDAINYKFIMSPRHLCLMKANTSILWLVYEKQDQ
jgi:hypothetical protein